MLHLPTIILLFNLTANQLDGWELLSSVEIVMGYDEFMSTEVEKPVFSKNLLDRQGELLELEGFVIPLQQDLDQDYFVLSRFPYQSCFFCGAAGPETVIEVYTDQKFTFTDERVRVIGKLRLNKDNPLHLFYILDDATAEKIN